MSAPAISTDDAPIHAAVVSLRLATSGLAPGSAGRLRDIASEAEAQGATLCAFGPFEVCLAFTDIEEAAAFAAHIVAAKGELPRAGLSVGDLTPYLPGEGFVRLSFGAPIVVATALARLAQPGEIIVDAATAEGRLPTIGPERSVTLGGKPRVAYALDTSSFGSTDDSIDLASTHETIAAPSPDADSSVGREMLELAREALTKTHEVSLDRAIAELNLTDEHADVVERLAGVLAMTRGAKEEGLRVLRRAAEGEQRDDRRARAVLAYAIGVAGAGRHDDALLEALSALAITRARGDRSGEKACARFLAQLSFSTGQAEAASAWEHVAQAADPVEG